ncbi:hypothetical protein F5146DRAFT_638985 [Armillaria mellea]|nr:hypothetical protein F5146DRAFT_638985 [Armillaria mellea]
MWALSRPTLFPDRFQLGGPLSVRSFQSNGLGPRDGSDSLGGDIYWSAGLSIISNIPRKAHWPVKTHLWLNAGRLDAMDRCQACLVHPLIAIHISYFSPFSGREHQGHCFATIRVCRRWSDI